MAVTISTGALSSIVHALARAAETEAGQQIVAGHDEDYEVSIPSEGSVIVRMRGGHLELVDVTEGEPAFCAYTRIEFDPAATPSIIAGSVTPAEAADSGTMLMRSRLYGGGQFMGLLRLAQKLDLLKP